MPHRDKRATLRSKKVTIATPKDKVQEKEVSEFRTMSAIQALKYGVEHRINKPQGWLLRLLQKEGSYEFTFGFGRNLNVNPKLMFMSISKT